ncbi:hypothetical protein EV359DRAFT_61421 [Lentinula novae-zelandiae]|nr:hypothetical protein EV359DRAFT_61421 [Lentinula novae-zelandiae]
MDIFIRARGSISPDTKTSERRDNIGRESKELPPSGENVLKVVSDDGTSLVVGDIRSDCPGDCSKGIYSLLKDYEVGGVNYGKDKVLIKVIGGMDNPESKVDDKAWGEVKALKDVGLYIDSGMANVDHGNYPVIVMKMVEGVRIQDTIEYKYAKVDQKEKLLEEAKPCVQKEIVHFAVEKGILHVQVAFNLLHIKKTNFVNVSSSDFHLGNFLVGGTKTSKGLVLETPITKAQLVDWGYPGVFKVKKGVTKAEVEEWFELQWERKSKL